MTEGVKYDDNKPRHDLVPGDALDAIAQVLTYGANKFAAMMRHAWAFWRGEEIDPESKLPHMAHAACCAMMLLTYFLRSTGDDDRYEDKK